MVHPFSNRRVLKPFKRLGAVECLRRQEDEDKEDKVNKVFIKAIGVL
jgi:hypothetical protein